MIGCLPIWWGTMPVMARTDKAREVILRRRAGRRGLRVERSRRRDTAALGYGLYRIVDSVTGEIYAGDSPGVAVAQPTRRGPVVATHMPAG